MLQTLRIRNYALIEQVELEFGDGFNVLTGETGAGKSIVVGALNLVLGARASGEFSRNEGAPTKIEAVFLADKPSRRLSALLEEHAIELEGGELLLSRVISKESRSRAYVAGNLVTLSVLAAIGDELVDLHGQHEHQSLLKTDRQLELLDAFAGTESAVETLGAKVQELRAITHRLEELQTADRERVRRMDFLRYEVTEIGKANLEVGEDTEIKSRLNLIENAEKIVRLASEAHGLLYESEASTPALDSLARAAQGIEELAQIDGRFEPLVARLQNVQMETESVAEELRAYHEEIAYDPAELDGLRGRLALIGDLGRKYGDSIEAILGYRDKAAEELDAYENRDRHIAELTEERDALDAAARKTADALSKKRKSAARKLDKQVSAALGSLGMAGGSFLTQLSAGELTSNGTDRIEFLLSANQGEKQKPLRQVASGGEVSRIMLALKAVFAQADAIPTLIFDEIDAGVGGAMAGKVAQKLLELSQSHQTICVTHLPQIAAVASRHHHISKHTQNGKTITKATPVNAESRIEEIARLLDGSLTEVSLEHARSLLEG